MKRKREREAMPPEYVKGPGKPGQLNPHWRKSFPDDEADADGRGKVVDVPDALRLYGEWRRVPGFWKILASDEGFIATEGDVSVRTPTCGHEGYFRVTCNGRPDKVHLLVARAFHGRPTSDQVSVDHKDRNEANNCAANLQWATLEQQRRNQGEHKASSSGEPCLVWQVVGGKRQGRNGTYDTTPVENTERRFPSLLVASKALGIDSGCLSSVLSGKSKTVVNTDKKRYTGKWEPDLVDLEGEEWKEIPITTRNRLFLSNYGRIQRIYSNGREGTKHYAESSNAKGYMEVGIDGKQKYVHILVGELFFVGPKPRNWAEWDHKDRDTHNNHISNLRPVTHEENRLNTARQRDFYLWPVGNPDDWVRCVSQIGTARSYGIVYTNLNQLLNKYASRDGYVRKRVGGYCAAFCDEVDAQD